MESLTFDYQDTCKIDSSELAALQDALLPEIERIAASRTTGYNSDYASINLPFDAELHKKICVTVKEKKQLHPTTLVVIGIV